MGALHGLGDCPLAFGDDQAAARYLVDGIRRCAWDGKELTGRRRRWCSDACGHAFAQQHTWSVAREAAKERDGQMCRICGRGWGAAKVLTLLLILGGHDPREAAARVDEDFKDLFVAWCRSPRLEVNHVTPRRGGGYHAGCWNHLDGLETLCHDCHVIETKRQQAHLFGGRGPADPRVEQLRLSA